jgi:hypothetical protein
VPPCCLPAAATAEPRPARWPVPAPDDIGYQMVTEGNDSA